MHPALVITLAAAAALPLGLWLRHDLNQLGYRTADEQDLPNPGTRWWVVWASVSAAAASCAAAVLSGDPVLYLPFLPLVVSGPWLAAVDFDVLRIPNNSLALVSFATAFAVLGVAMAKQNLSEIIPPVLAAIVTGGLFAGIHVATKGGIGFGDVKLVSVIGLALGPLGAGVVWLGVLSGSLAALFWAKARRRAGPTAYGPWLLAGSVLAVAGLGWVS